MKYLLIVLTTVLFSCYACSQQSLEATSVLNLGNNLFSGKGTNHGFCVLQDELETFRIVELENFDTVYEYFAGHVVPVFDYLPEIKHFFVLDDLDGNFNFIGLDYYMDNPIQSDTLGFFNKYFKEHHPGIKVFQTGNDIYIRPEENFEYIIAGTPDMLYQNNLLIKAKLASKKLELDFRGGTVKEVTLREIGSKSGKPDVNVNFLQIDKFFESKNQEKWYQNNKITALQALSNNEIVFVEVYGTETNIVKSKMFQASILDNNLGNDHPERSVLYSSKGKIDNLIVSPGKNFLLFNEGDVLMIYNLSAKKITYTGQNEVVSCFDGRNTAIIFNEADLVYNFYSLSQGKILSERTIDFSEKFIDAIADDEIKKKHKSAASQIKKAIDSQLDIKNNLLYFSNNKTINALNISSMEVVAIFGDSRYDNIFLLENNRLLSFSQSSKKIEIWSLDGINH